MNKVKTGIIGCGKVGHLHAIALGSVPESEFVAVCGTNAERTGVFAAQYGVEAYTDVGEMLEKSGVQAVCICTPHPLHAQHAVLAAQMGVHILVEKPLAASLKDCDLILEASNVSGVKVGTVSQRRFYEPCQRIKKAIDEGKIGRPILGTVTMYSWRDEAYYKSDHWRGTWLGEGGGVLVNQAPHQLDLLRWFMGPITEVSAYCGNLNHPTIEVEDTAVAILRFASGALGHITVSNSQNPALWSKVSVHGSNGASLGVQTDGGAMFIAGMSSITEPPINDIWTIAGEESSLAVWQHMDTLHFDGVDPTTYYHGLQISDFLRAITEDREPLISGNDGRATVELFTAIYRSQRDGAPVRFPLISEHNLDDFDGRLCLNSRTN
jgi:UDP-N-acetyl-2-amino-2-deoxyglucuronate dehydrogenase